MTDRPDDRLDDDGAPPLPTQTTAPHEERAAAPPSWAPQTTVDASGTATPRPAPKVATRRPLLVPILAAATVVLLILTILLGLMALAPRAAPIKTKATKLAAQALEEEEISAVARRFARNFVTIDYRTIDEDLKRMSADATGNFKEQLERTIKVIGEQFEERKARSTGRSLDSAVLSHEAGTALVQVLLRRAKQNVGTKGPESGNQIVNVSLILTEDGWKVDDLRQLPGEES